MLITRLAKIAMCVSLALFCLLVFIDNVVSYGTNYEFVRHVLSMDTTFPTNDIRSRAITDPTLWQVAYVTIIAAEGATGLLFLIGASNMLRTLRSPGIVFNSAKGFAVAGALLAFLVWFFGFMVVGGEWFAMWQSRTWNGQQAAFRFYVTVLGVLIFLNQADPDLTGSDNPAGR